MGWLQRADQRNQQTMDAHRTNLGMRRHPNSLQRFTVRSPLWASLAASAWVAAMLLIRREPTAAAIGFVVTFPIAIATSRALQRRYKT